MSGHQQSPPAVGHQANSWLYANIWIGQLKIPHIASPPFQLLLISWVCFLCPGLFNALGGLGGVGQSNLRPADNSLTALYATFCWFGVFSGTVTNMLGVKLTIFVGTIGYWIFSLSFLTYNYIHSDTFVIVAGAILGFCAGLLWCAQAVVMISYPPELSKGKYIAWFWAIFNFGGVLGAAVPLALNSHDKGHHPVSNATYVVFTALMISGSFMALTLCDADKIIRSDGSRVIIMKNPTVRSEIMGFYLTIKHNWYFLALFPMFFASNWFYTYQFNDVNAGVFNTRTRTLNNILYWVAQIAGAFLAGYSLDTISFRRSVRARCALGLLFLLTMIVYGGGLAFEINFSRNSIGTNLDWSQGEAIAPMILFVSYGMYDAIWQICVYWFMGTLSNSGRKVATFAGMYKSLQSAGAAISWRIDGLGASRLTEFIASWSLLIFALFLAAPLIIHRIKDVVPIEDGLHYMDADQTDFEPQVQIPSQSDLELEPIEPEPEPDTRPITELQHQTVDGIECLISNHGGDPLPDADNPQQPTTLDGDYITTEGPLKLPAAAPEPET